MMKNTFCSLLILVSGFAFGQLSDSISVTDNSTLEYFDTQIWKNPLQQNAIQLKDYTAVTLKYTSIDLAVRRAQTAESISDVGFETKGLYQYTHELKLFGSFGYDFIAEKDVAFNLSDRRTEEDFVLNPNYLFVPKKSNWEMQKYQIRGGASYTPGNLSFAATIDYRNQNSYRKTDPRPQISTADYTGKIFAGYQMGNHQISAFGGYGRTTENNDVMAVNEFINSPSNPDYFVRFSNGYGRVVYFPSFSDFLYRTTLKNYGAGYRYQKSNVHLSLNYSHHKTMENIYVKSGQNQVYIDKSLETMKYREITHEIFGSAVYTAGTATFMADFGAEFVTGDNFNNQEQGQNYRKTLDRYFADFSYLQKSFSGKYRGLTLESQLNHFSGRDLLGVTDKKVQSLDLGLNAQSDLYRNGNRNVNARLGIHHYFPILTELNYAQATSNTMFYNNVMLHDHYYDLVSKTGISAEISFTDRIRKNTSWRFFTKLATVLAHQKDPVPTDYFKNPTLVFQTGVTFFY